MKDRIPTYPGRVKLTPVQGSTDLFDMERADQPFEAGTPINKETLLTDEVAAVIGNPSTPNEAFLSLYKTKGNKATTWEKLMTGRFI